MTGREEAGLRGPVGECITETEYPSGVAVTERRFARDGRLLDARHRNPNGSEWSASYRYGEDGRLLETEYGGGEEFSGDRHFRYEYDSLGRLQRVTARNAAGEERVYQSHTYEPSGEHRLTEYRDPALQARHVNTSAELMLERTADTVAVLTFFDAADRPVKRILYDGNDSVIRRVLIRHDEQGRIVEEGEAEPGGKIRGDFRHVYLYDDRGRRIEADMHWYAFGGQRVRTTYNDRGDIAKEQTLRRAGEVDLGHGDREWVQKYEYAYDHRGNWLTRTSTTHSPPEAQASDPRTERRRIAYWDEQTA
jgi:hypothetical protein